MPICWGLANLSSTTLPQGSTLDLTSIFNRIIFGLDEAIQAPFLRLYQRGDEMKKDALEKFLKEKKISNEEKLSKFDRVARLKQWQVQVAFLYQQIEKFLILLIQSRYLY